METLQLWENVPGLCEEVPVLDFYPAADKRTDATVVICPGGGYSHRAVHEGKGYAEYLNSIGMNAFVCQYRVSPHRFPLPLLDIRRSIRYVRANAERFGIDPAKVAVMGSSAGGHLSALVSTYTEPLQPDGDTVYEGLDEIDTFSALPDATILCYPVIHCAEKLHGGSFINLLGHGVSAPHNNYSCDLLVSDNTPPAFIWHTSEDSCVNVINSYMYATALREHNILCEMHVFPKGPHGMGLAEKMPHVAQWAGLMKNWFVDMGWLA